MQMHKNSPALPASCPSHLAASLFTTRYELTFNYPRNFVIKTELENMHVESKKKKKPSSHTLPKPNLKSLHQSCARLWKPSVFKAYLPPCLPQPVCWFNNLQWDFTHLIMQNHCLCIRSATCLTNLNSVTPFLGGSPVWRPPTGPQIKPWREGGSKTKGSLQCACLYQVGQKLRCYSRWEAKNKTTKQKEKKNTKKEKPAGL